MAGRNQAPGHNVKLSMSLYASVVKAAELQGQSPGQWVEKAVRNELSQDRAIFKADEYWHLRRLHQSGLSDVSPVAYERGLPEKFDESPVPSTLSPFTAFRPPR